MRNSAHIIFLILCVLCPHIAAADVYEIAYGDDYVTPIVIDDSTTIINHGTLSGDVTLSAKYVVTIQNYGDISSHFYCGEICYKITQEIFGNDSLRPIPNLSGHIVSVSNNHTDIISMTDLINVAMNASEIHLGGGTYAIGANVPLFPKDIIIYGDDIVFVITEIPADLSRPLISHVMNSNLITQIIFSPEIDDIYYSRWFDDSLYVFASHYTNYSVIFDGALGEYLDSLRDKNPHDKLLEALDSVNSRDEVANILSKSARTNPVNLMNTIISLNSHDLIRFAPGTVITPFYLFSDDFSIMGANINIGSDISDKLFGNIGFIGGAINYSGDLDDYSGALYGGNIGVRYMDDKYYMHAYGKFVYARFDDLDILDNDKIVSGPSGFDINVVSDFGLVYRFDDTDLIPFIGSRVDYVSIASENDMNFNLRIGVKAEKSDTTDGNDYKIGGMFFMQTDGAIYGGLYMDMLSVADGVGGGFEVGALYDDMGLSYRLALNGKIIF